MISDHFLLVSLCKYLRDFLTMERTFEGLEMQAYRSQMINPSLTKKKKKNSEENSGFTLKAVITIAKVSGSSHNHIILYVIRNKFAFQHLDFLLYLILEVLEVNWNSRIWLPKRGGKRKNPRHLPWFFCIKVSSQ